MRFLRIWLLPALLAAVSALAQAGTIEGAEFKSAVLGRSWAFNVYLPTGYDPSGPLRYPVLYLLHGNGGDRNEWVLKGRIRRITIVAMARKLMVALWRYLTTGVVPTGAVLRPSF